jgi:hypothetical protein
MAFSFKPQAAQRPFQHWIRHGLRWIRQKDRGAITVTIPGRPPGSVWSIEHVQKYLDSPVKLVHPKFEHVQ